MIKNTLEGICVNTMVFTSPKRLVIQAGSIAMT
jgi:hypothetical protein